MYLEYSTRALIDIDDQAAFIQVQSPRSALRFMEAVEATSELLLRFPEFGSLVEFDGAETNGLRVCQVKKSEKHLIFYRVIGEKIRIDRVLHGSRDLPNVLKEDE